MQFSKVDEMQIMFDLSGHWGNNGVIRLLFFLFSKNWSLDKASKQKNVLKRSIVHEIPIFAYDHGILLFLLKFEKKSNHLR